MELIPSTKKIKYNQNSQALSMNFSLGRKFPDDKIQELFYPFYCREYLNDILNWNYKPFNANIYGFIFNKNSDYIIDKDKTRLILRISKKEEINNFFNNLDILRDIEEKNNFIRTIDGINYYDDTTLIVEADPRYQNNPILISIYTFLLKCLCYKYKDKSNWLDELKKNPGNESYYISILNVYFRGWKKILDNLNKFIQFDMHYMQEEYKILFPSLYLNKEDIHNLGFLTYFQQSRKNNTPICNLIKTFYEMPIV